MRSAASTCACSPQPTAMPSLTLERDHSKSFRALWWFLCVCSSAVSWLTWQHPVVPSAMAYVFFVQQWLGVTTPGFFFSCVPSALVPVSTGTRGLYGQLLCIRSQFFHLLSRLLCLRTTHGIHCEVLTSCFFLLVSSLFFSSTSFPFTCSPYKARNFAVQCLNLVSTCLAGIKGGLIDLPALLRPSRVANHFVNLFRA